MRQAAAEIQLKKAIELNAGLLNARELLVLAHAAMENEALTQASIADAVAHGSDEARMRQTIELFLKSLEEA